MAKPTDGAILVPQAHGGALRSFPPAPQRSGWKAARKQALGYLRDATPDSVEKLIALTQSQDDRVAMVATKELLDRTLGKPSDAGQGDTEEAATADLSHLTPVEIVELSTALATVRRLTGRGRQPDV